MSQHISAKKVAASRPSVTLLMILCGIVGATAASAATPKDDVPALKVRYTADALDTDHGAKVLYTRLVHAAEQVCPAEFQRQPFGQRGGPRLPRPGRRPGGASNQ
jgi:UrcA family protein